MSLEVVQPGLFSTFQDLGRYGVQKFGVPVSGAMDELSHRLANLLVGNADGEATLEVMLLGPVLRFKRAATIALAGADLGATLNDQPMPLAAPVRVPEGATLQFGKRRAGLRAYLALAGGFGLPAVLGSVSTYVRGGFGGYQGRSLRKGDILDPPGLGIPRHPASPVSGIAARLLQALAIIDTAEPLRILAGREWEDFTVAARQALLACPYRVGAQSDRMGYRLEGPVLERGNTGDMLSEAVAFGTMQVPPDGQPIVLMADRQASGGYPRIAQVASIDLPRLAQVMPGEPVRFTLITLEQAQALLRWRAQSLDALRCALSTA
jgi:urea carboxylase